MDFYGKPNIIRGTEIPGLIDPDRTKNDFLQYKFFHKSQAPLTALCNQTLFATMARLLLVSPVASVPKFPK